MKRNLLGAALDWFCCGTLLTFCLCCLFAACFLVACCSEVLGL